MRRRRPDIPRPKALVVLMALVFLGAARPPGPFDLDPEICETPLVGATGRAEEWLERARRAVGLTDAGGPLLRLDARTVAELRDQSDRPYPPYIAAVSRDRRWVDAEAGVERIEPEGSPVALLAGPAAAFVAPDSGPAAPSAGTHARLASDRDLDPWLALADWAGSPDLEVEGECQVRGYPRIVVRRGGALGPERLFLDAATAIPVALTRNELHYFLGPERIVYLYMTWWDVKGGGLYPVAVARMADGERESTRTVFPGSADLVPRSEAPPLALPDPDLVQRNDPEARFAAGAPDTVRIGEHAFLLASPAFTDVVALARDTVFLMDAPAGEERARQDAEWIERLFPGDHPVVLVAMNTTWPHVAGLRAWVARGATVVSAASSRPVLERVVGRDWSLAPDLLERSTPRPALRFRGVDDSLRLAGGEIALHAIDGTSGEGALLAWLPRERFLWASDHLQSLDSPSIYERNVVRTARRLGLDPRWTSGPHFGRESWSRLASDVEPAITPGGAARYDVPPGKPGAPDLARVHSAPSCGRSRPGSGPRGVQRGAGDRGGGLNRRLRRTVPGGEVPSATLRRSPRLERVRRRGATLVCLGAVLAGPSAHPAAAAGSAAPCVLRPADRAWMQRIVDGWAYVAGEVLETDPEPLPRMVLFDSTCRWDVAEEAGPDAGPIAAELNLAGRAIPVRGRAHQGVVRLPNGAEIPAEIIAVAMPYGDGEGGFLALALPELWARHPEASKDPHLDVRIPSVALHEMVHTRQLGALRRRVEDLSGRYDLPERFDDDLIEGRFRDVPGYAEAYEAERDLFYEAVSASDPGRRDSLVREALARARDRRERFFGGARVPWAELEGLFLNMEGVAEWVRFRYHRSRPDWPTGTEEVLAFLRGSEDSWSQDEGLALVLLLDAMVPDWKRQLLGPEMASPLDLLERAVTPADSGDREPAERVRWSSDE